MTKKVKKTREDVANLLVSDKFFDGKHPLLTIRQSLLALLGWCGVLLQFVWILFPSLFPKTAAHFNFRTYAEGYVTFDLLKIFLGVAFLIILVVYLILTIKNNRHFKSTLRNTTMYDEEKLAGRKQALDEFYTERFGTKEFRESVQFYSVTEEQNLETDDIKNLYEEKGVKL